MTHMTGGVAKGILIFCCLYFVVVMVGLAASGQTALAAFMLVGLFVPVSFVIYGYMQDRKDKKNSLKHPMRETDSGIAT